MPHLGPLHMKLPSKSPGSYFTAASTLFSIGGQTHTHTNCHKQEKWNTGDLPDTTGKAPAGKVQALNTRVL